MCKANKIFPNRGVRASAAVRRHVELWISGASEATMSGEILGALR